MRFARRSILPGAVLLLMSILPLRGQNPEVEKTLIVIQESIQAGNRSVALKRIAAALARFPKEAGLYNLRGIIHAQ